MSCIDKLDGNPESHLSRCPIHHSLAKQRVPSHNLPSSAVDCEWSEFSDWGGCNLTCGGGMQNRIREPIGPFYGGAECTGPHDNWQSCNEQECPSE